MLYEMLSQFPQHVLPLPCNVCVTVTSERRQGDVNYNYCSLGYHRMTFE